MGGKYYIAVDCEGVACAVGEPCKGLGEANNYQFAVLQATREANAAVTALFDAGASEVIVWDAHGSGVNLNYDILDKRCSIVLGSGHNGRWQALDNTFTAVLFIGYHAREGCARATLAHTYCSAAFQYYKINGIDCGELAIDAAWAGEYNVPVLFCSGDDCLLAEANELFENLSTVQTKKALSWTSALSRHPLAVCEDIYSTVLNACKENKSIKPYKFSSPLSLEIRYKRMEDAEKAILIDKNGKAFTRKDAFTRSGEMQSVLSLF